MGGEHLRDGVERVPRCTCLLCGRLAEDGGRDAGRVLLFAVDLDVFFCGVFCVFVGMGVMSMRDVRVMSRLFVVAGFVMLRGLVMVVGSLRMVMGSLLVMMRCFLGHVCLHSGSQTISLVRKPVWNHRAWVASDDYDRFN